MKSLKVSKEIWQQVKVEAAKQNITINEFVTQALKAKLKQSVADEKKESKS
jgi:predicted HicB family RNase H-like nuclease